MRLWVSMSIIGSLLLIYWQAPAGGPHRNSGLLFAGLFALLFLVPHDDGEVMPESRGHSWVLMRSVTLIIATALCGMATEVVSLVALQLSLPPSDGGHGPWWSMLESSMFRPIADMLTAASVTISLPFALILLMPTQLRKSIPLVSLSTIAMTAIVAPLAYVLSPISGLAAGLAAMVLCRRLFPLPRARAAC